MEPLPPSEAWQSFLDLAHSGDAEIALDRAALLIAGQAQSELNIPHWLAKLDALGERLVERAPLSLPAEERLWALCRFVDGELGITGNTKHYYEPQNSFLNRVIDRGLGIPISIAVVLLELGRRADVALRGIGFPGHFLLEHCEAPVGYLDPFDLSRLLRIEDCAAMLERASQGKLQLDSSHLEPVGTRELLTRMLSNLKAVHVRRHEYLQAIRMIDGILALAPTRWVEYRDRGQLYAKIEFDGQAELDLTRYLESVPQSPDAPRVRAVLETVRERLSQYH